MVCWEKGGFWMKKLIYDPAVQQPAVRKSICTGEQTAGFVELATGKFHEHCLLRTPKELAAFCRACGVEPSELREVF